MHNPFKSKSKRRQRAQLQEDTGFSAEQFIAPEPQVPWQAISLAILLFLAGSALIVVGVLIKLGYITANGWGERGIPFIVIGCIMFIPGVYHMYIAYYAYYRYPGYEFAMIPDWGE
ncbi:hypothetical protein CLU79DRAFT_755410 [Phycomyces nitens]|nr:hypothetical protein CLU79DRAFT_755410 [Phycomyces nitens]